jgi:hypothetical protein
VSNGGDGLRHPFPPIGDEGRQQRGRAEAPVRGGDRGYASGVRLVVEQDIAAAVHLHIDEAGREPGSGGKRLDRNVGGDLATSSQRGDPLALDQHSRTLMKRLPVKDVIGGDSVPLRPAHRVRVTFFRWRGRSTSRPRCAASWTAIP